MNSFILSLSIVFWIAFSSESFCQNEEAATKKAHLDAAWYASDSITLMKDLNNMFKFYMSNYKNNFDPNSVKAIISPHASLFYSGICAMSSYGSLITTSKDLLIKNKQIKHVLILAPSHFKNFNGIICPAFEQYQTPLGKIKINKTNVNLISKEINRQPQNDFFEQEHSLEMQLPFLQYAIENFKITPVIVGNINETNRNKIASILNKVIDDQTLVIISSDFTHYGEKFNYEPFIENKVGLIKTIDDKVFKGIFNQDYNRFEQVISETKATVCGRNPLRLFLSIQSDHLSGLQGFLTNYYTSAHVHKGYEDGSLETEELFGYISDQNIESSVSYGSILFMKSDSKGLDKFPLSKYDKLALSNMAEEILINQFAKPKSIPDESFYSIESPGIAKKYGLFVTINKDKKLRGCMGKIQNEYNTREILHYMTLASAFQDSRFDSISIDELEELDLEISLLMPPKAVDSIQQIQLGKHGIIFKKLTNKKLYSAVFLPQVPMEQGWNLEQTLSALARKSGLDQNAWKEEATFEVFEGIKFSFE
ncbi:MAG: AmmeMemoRadiSam system protein B [Flavobacteriales bacterium]|nr:AmmeMemoRadiSam system protein B [Flavobacteriales bacterium]